MYVYYVLDKQITHINVQATYMFILFLQYATIKR